MAVPPYDILQPRIFNYNKISDCALSEGRMLIPFGFTFSQVSNGINQLVPVPGFNVLGVQTTIDFKNFASITPMRQIKTLQFCMDFVGGGGGQTNQFGAFIVSVPDSGEFFMFGPNTQYRTIDTTAVVNQGTVTACIEIITNATQITFTKLQDTIVGGAGAVINGRLWGSVSNFERQSFVHNTLVQI